MNSSRSLAKFNCLNFDFQLYILLHDMLALQKIGPVTTERAQALRPYKKTDFFVMEPQE